MATTATMLAERWPRLRRSASLALLAVLVAAPLASSASGTATLRGTVYGCSDHLRVAGARVWVRSLDDGSERRLASDGNGRFVQVGMTPGRYIVTATSDSAVWLGVSAASRAVELESDDVLDMAIGISRLKVVGIDVYRSPDPNRPHPLCDPPRVPLAAPTTDRYIMH